MSTDRSLLQARYEHLPAAQRRNEHSRDRQVDERQRDFVPDVACSKKIGTRASSAQPGAEVVAGLRQLADALAAAT
jgi:hypothetical protein